MEGNAFPMIFACCSSVSDWDFTLVPERTTLTVYSQTPKGGAAEVEVGAAITAGPAGALVRHYYGNGAFCADALVEALNLKACPTALAVLENYWARCSNPRLQRLHVH